MNWYFIGVLEFEFGCFHAENLNNKSCIVHVTYNNNSNIITDIKNVWNWISNNHWIWNFLFGTNNNWVSSSNSNRCLSKWLSSLKCVFNLIDSSISCENLHYFVLHLKIIYNCNFTKKQKLIAIKIRWSNKQNRYLKFIWTLLSQTVKSRKRSWLVPKLNIIQHNLQKKNHLSSFQQMFWDKVSHKCCRCDLKLIGFIEHPEVVIIQSHSIIVQLSIYQNRSTFQRRKLKSNKSNTRNIQDRSVDHSGSKTKQI